MDGSWDSNILYNGTALSYLLLFVLWLIIFIIFNICNIIYLLNKIKNNNIEIIKKCCIIIKISIIPFWLINIILHFSLYLIFINNYNLEIFIIPMPIIISYIILLSTSSYSIIYLVFMKKNGFLNKNKFILNIILQLLFFIDIIGILKIIKENKNISNVA
ncbi:MAG: hypothetical protein FWD26_08245 [Treponema sp.]|nr:hypothetical protein [Treponema sp.]